MALELYDHSVYDGVPSLYDAGRHFDLKNGDDLVDTKFRKLFIEHNMDRVFGLSLLHRHFDLDSDELLVEYKGTAIPWKETFEKTSPFIRPSNWALAKDGTFRPFEFSYVKQDAEEDTGALTDPKYHSFIQSFKDLLDQEGATDLFGLCKYPGDDFKGRANINLDPDDYPSTTNVRTAAWYFSPQVWRKCVCVCAQNTRGHSGSHKGHVNSR